MSDVQREDLRVLEQTVRDYLAQRDTVIGERLDVVRERADALKEAVRDVHREMKNALDAYDVRLTKMDERIRAFDHRLRADEHARGETPRSRQGDVIDWRRDWQKVLLAIGVVAMAAVSFVQMVFAVIDKLRGLGLR